ncbi:MAG: hypothetical protein KA479_08930 [Saprospiraceae bacterium]|nr:hypothetical protein [Saprospiraceae bacterium]
MNLNWLLSLVVIVTSISCKTSHNALPAGTSATVEVNQAAAYSGCQCVLRTKDGRQFIPVSYSNASCTLQAGEVYSIRYEMRDEAVYGCTLKGALPIHLLACIKLENSNLKGTGGIKPERPICAWTTDVFAIPWMVQIIKQIDPDKITRFQYQSNGAYSFESQKGHYLFDCFGNLICNEAKGELNCLVNHALSDQYVILVRNY